MRRRGAMSDSVMGRMTASGRRVVGRGGKRRFFTGG